MKRKSGKEFEDIVKHVYDAITALENGVGVRRNVRMDSHDGPREFDIVLDAFVCGESVVTVIECRDLNQRADVTHIDGFASKIDGVPSITKGVIITRMGFTKKALAKAKRLGISTYTIDKLSSIPQVGREFPVIIEEISPVGASYSGEFKTTVASSVDTHIEPIINGKPISMYLTESMPSILLLSSTGDSELTWEPKPENGPLYFTLVDGTLMQLINSRVEISVLREYYFGHLHELPNTVEFVNSQTQEVQHFFKPDELCCYRNIFARYKSVADIPKARNTRLSCIVIKEGSFSSLPMKIVEKT